MSRSLLSRAGVVPSVVALSVSLALGGCGGGSGGDGASPSTLIARAVDGFIVGASVSCDGVPNGGTAAGGRLVCPTDTVLASVRGGTDVGFDETATSGGLPFVGEMVAPAALGWVTPLSTVAVAMSSDEDGYRAAGFPAAVDALAASLDQSALDLSADPTSVVQLVRLNAQVNQLVGAFGTTEDGYRKSTRTFAALLSESAVNGRAWSLDDGAGELLGVLNARLAAEGSNLAMDATTLEETVARVRAVNAAIANAPSPDLVFGAAVAAPVSGQALTIDRDATLLSYDAFFTSRAVSLAEFESAEKERGFGAFDIDPDGSLTDEYASETHAATLDGSGLLSLNGRAFTVDRDLDAQPVSIGFALDATDDGDERAIAVVTSDARVSARRGDDDSVAIVLPKGATLRVRSVADDATVTTATIRLKTEHAFRSENGGIDLSFWRIDRELERRGFGDLTARAGDYRMTVAIGGIRINEREGDETRRATNRTVDVGETVVTGSGFEGYVTIVPSEFWYEY